MGPSRLSTEILRQKNGKVRNLTNNSSADLGSSATDAPALVLPDYRVVKGIALVYSKICQNEENAELSVLEA